jgi:DNA-binding XRE family transcriptional regulator
LNCHARAFRDDFERAGSDWLAQETGLSESTIAELEKGRRRPHPSTKRELAQALRVRVEDILWP